MPWSEANAYCAGLSPQARLPTRKELQDLFVSSTSATVAGGSVSNNDMCTIHGWPLFKFCGGKTAGYWTREVFMGSIHYYVYMNDGAAYIDGDTVAYNVTCVRW